MRRSAVLSLCVGFAMACAALFAADMTAQEPGGNPEARKLQNPVPSTPDSIGMGAKLYQKNCQFCHGPKGLGDGPLAPPGSQPGNLVDGKWAHGGSDGEIFWVIQNGIEPYMPPAKGRLSDTDIWHVVNFIRSIGPKEDAGQR